MVWWRGSCGHVWREKVSMRSMRVDDSCPYCKNRKLLRGFNDLATTHPELVAEWDFERNGDLGPDRRDRQLQQARLVEVQGEPRVVRPHSEPGAQGQGGPGLSVLLGTQGARRLQRPGHHASQHSGHVAPAHEQALCFATLIFRFSRLIFFGFHVSRQGRTANFPNLRTCPS